MCAGIIFYGEIGLLDGFAKEIAHALGVARHLGCYFAKLAQHGFLYQFAGLFTGVHTTHAVGHKHQGAVITHRRCAVGVECLTSRIASLYVEKDKAVILVCASARFVGAEGRIKFYLCHLLIYALFTDDANLSNLRGLHNTSLMKYMVFYVKC